MDYKARSKSMRNILSHLIADQEFEVVVFGDQVILEEPIEQWPKCDILIAFFSAGFPLQKAIDYYNLMRPYSVNDLLMQELLLDRRTVLAILDAIDVPTIPRLVVNYDRPVLSYEAMKLATRNFGVDFYCSEMFNLKPAEEYAGYIEVNQRKLMRPFVEKPADAENHNVHVYYADGSGRKLFRKIENKSSQFVEDMSSVRRDSKSYVYEQYVSMDNAEDVKVYTIGPYNAYAETRRSPSVDGTVKRNSEGKEIRNVTELSPEEQDIARRICMAFGQTICGFDMLRVNGRPYVIDVNGWSFVKGSSDYDELCAKILRQTFLKVVPRIPRVVKEGESGGQWKLKCFVEVLRHADRTPKQKLKIVTEADDFALVDEVEEMSEKLELCLELAQKMSNITKDPSYKKDLERCIEVLKQKKHLLSTKIQRRSTSEGKTLLIIKWGGEFTHAGRHQAQELGEATRKDLGILNRDVLQDLTIMCSVERRVQATADVFTKGILKIAEVPSQLISLRKDILDHASVAKTSLEKVKMRLSAELNEPSPHSARVHGMLEDFRAELCRMRDLMKRNMDSLSASDLAKFQWCCSESPALFRERWEQHFKDLLDTEKIDPSRISDFYDSLKYDALHNREFLQSMVTEREDGQSAESLIRSLFKSTQCLFAFLSPKEAGMTASEKLAVGAEIIGPLVQEIIGELTGSIEKDHVKTRLYFTKESHMVALMNVIMNSGIPLARRRTSSVMFPEELTEDPSWFGELDYLSQICFELYERKKIDKKSGEQVSEHSLRIGMSQGAHDPHLIDTHLDRRHSLSVSRKKWLTYYVPALDAITILKGHLA